MGGRTFGLLKCKNTRCTDWKPVNRFILEDKSAQSDYNLTVYSFFKFPHPKKSLYLPSPSKSLRTPHKSAKTIAHIKKKEEKHQPPLNGQAHELRHQAPMFLGHEGDEYLREVDPGDVERERYHQYEENLLISAKLPDVGQQIVKVDILGLLLLAPHLLAPPFLLRHGHRRRVVLSGRIQRLTNDDAHVTRAQLLGTRLLRAASALTELLLWRHPSLILSLLLTYM